MYDKLVAKVNNIDTSGFILKTKYDTDLEKKINNADKKIPDTSGLIKKAKITELVGKIPSINALATNSALTAVENKTSDLSNLVKKTDYDTKIPDVENKCITTADYNKFNVTGFDRRETFSFPSGGFGCNVINFVADMRSSVHEEKKKRYFNSW